MEIGAIGAHSKIQCHTCHLFGHIAKDCKLMKKPSTGARPKEGGAAATTGGAGRGGGRKPWGRGEPEKKSAKRNRFINEICSAAACALEELEAEEDEPEDAAAGQSPEEDGDSDGEKREDF
jgi:hypothetical protein